MLPAKKRIPRDRFESVAGSGSSVFNRAGTFRFVKGGMNFSVVVSSKYCKKAAARNKTKRRIYSIMYALLKNDPSPLSGVLYVSKHAYAMPFSELKSLIKNLFEQAYARNK